MDRTNAERQRRYIERLKDKAASVDGLRVTIRNQSETIKDYQLEDPNSRSCGLATLGDAIARIKVLEEFIRINGLKVPPIEMCGLPGA